MSNIKQVFMCFALPGPWRYNLSRWVSSLNDYNKRSVREGGRKVCQMQWWFWRVQEWIRKFSISLTFIFQAHKKRNLILFFRWVNERTAFKTAACKFSISFCTFGHLKKKTNLSGRQMCFETLLCASSEGKCLKMKINSLRAMWCMVVF